MRSAITLLLFAVLVSACSHKEADTEVVKQSHWQSKTIDLTDYDFQMQGKTYLPVYSHIYHVHKHETFDLTITVSIRNISPRDSVFILKADYFNTLGEKTRQYLKKPIYLSPLETVEIVIDEQDLEGGSGANFVFEWATRIEKNPPLFEAVMISTRGQQGLSFTTRGVPIAEDDQQSAVN